VSVKRTFNLTLILVLAVPWTGSEFVPQAAYLNDPMQVSTRVSVDGVCPPFYLYDEQGNVINPVSDENADRPYSPKQTCGKCHDYNKTTEGFHFQQGRGEKPDPLTAERCLWVTSPGNYGGNW
jgi:hypothetical protein